MSASELDDLDAELVIWAREIPDLDPLTEGIVERIHILAHDFNESMSLTLAEFDLDRRAFKLLGRLRSGGPPYRRSAGTLANDLQLSTGAMTNRLDRLEAAGLVRRLPDPNDRRGTLVEPTEAGHAAWDRTVGTQARREAMIASVLSTREREQLHRLLRRLMRAFPDKGHARKSATARPAPIRRPLAAHGDRRERMTERHRGARCARTGRDPVHGRAHRACPQRGGERDPPGDRARCPPAHHRRPARGGRLRLRAGPRRSALRLAEGPRPARRQAPVVTRRRRGRSARPATSAVRSRHSARAVPGRSSSMPRRPAMSGSRSAAGPTGSTSTWPRPTSSRRSRRPSPT